MTVRAAIPVALLTVSVFGGLPAQEKPTAPNDTAEWLPLAPGAKWTWRVKTNAGNQPDVVWHCIREVMAASKKPREKPKLLTFWEKERKLGEEPKEVCWAIRERRDDHVRWIYWDNRPLGILRYQSRFPVPIELHHLINQPKAVRLIPGPLGAATTWEWRESSSDMMRNRELPGKRLDVHGAGRIAAMNERIKVPAGEFSTVRIELVRQCERILDVKETVWLAREVGIVKWKIRSEKDASTFELRSFVPGRELSWTVDRISKLLKSDETCRELGTPALIRALPLATFLASRFHVAQWKHKTVVFRSLAGQTEIFRPEDTKAWNKLVRDELGKVRNQDQRHLVRIYGLLRWEIAFGSGRSRPTMPRMGIIDKDWLSVDLVFRNTAGERQTSVGQMWFENGRITKLSFYPKAK